MCVSRLNVSTELYFMGNAPAANGKWQLGILIIWWDDASPENGREWTIYWSRLQSFAQFIAQSNVKMKNNKITAVKAEYFECASSFRSTHEWIGNGIETCWTRPYRHWHRVHKYQLLTLRRIAQHLRGNLIFIRTFGTMNIMAFRTNENVKMIFLINYPADVLIQK